MSEKVNDICLFQNGFKCYPDILSFSNKAEIFVSKFETNVTLVTAIKKTNKQRTKLNNVRNVQNNIYAF